MSINRRLHNAAADVAATHNRRPLPQLESGSAFPRWAAAAALVTTITAAFIFISMQGGAPVDPATSTVVTTQTTEVTPSSEVTSTSQPGTSSTTTSIPPDADIAWTETDAERMVEGYLAALAADQWEIAAWSIENEGIVPDGAGDNENPADFLQRSCEPDLCRGPYSVVADGPGWVDAQSSQASSTVTVTHVPSGETGTIRIATFEGQPIIADLPPLVSGESQPLARTLFGDDLPNDLVVGGFNAVERWTGDSVAWSIQWLIEDVVDVDGSVALVYDSGSLLLTPIDSPQGGEAGSCASLLGRGVIPYEGCPPDVYGPTGEKVDASSFHPATGDDPGFAFYAGRANVNISGLIDSEGNLIELSTGTIDLLGDDYASVPRLSPDGSKIAYVDHADNRAESHFWSPVVVIKDTATGNELSRIAFEHSVLWLEFDGRWVVIGGRNADYEGGEPSQETIETFNLETGQVDSVETSVRLWLP